MPLMIQPDDSSGHFVSARTIMKYAPKTCMHGFSRNHMPCYYYDRDKLEIGWYLSFPKLCI